MLRPVRAVPASPLRLCAFAVLRLANAAERMDSGRQTSTGARPGRERPVDGALAGAPGCACARGRHPRVAACRRSACARTAGGARRRGPVPSRRLRRRGSSGHQPGHRLERAGRCAGCAARRPGGGRYRAVRAGAAGAGSGQGAGHHRLERQEHGDRDGRRHVPCGRVAHDRGRQHRPAGAGRAGAGRAGTGCGRAPSRGLRPRAVQLSARDHLHPGRPRGGVLEPERGPSRSLPEHGGLRRGQGPRLPRRGRPGPQPPGRLDAGHGDGEPPGPDLRPGCAGQRARLGIDPERRRDLAGAGQPEAVGGFAAARDGPAQRGERARGAGAHPRCRTCPTTRCCRR